MKIQTEDNEKNIKLNELHNQNEKSHITIARYIMQNDTFKTLRDTEEILIYEDGLYINKGESVIKEEALKILKSDFTTHQIKEITNYIKYSTFVERTDFNKNQGVLNLKNGLLDIRTSELKSHTPDFLSTIRIPISYNPDAKCPKIEKFFREILEESYIPLIEEAFGFVLYPEYLIHKNFLLVGVGRNGKSTFLNLLRAFIGDKNVTNVLIYSLEYNRFVASQLYGKLALINADLPDRTLTSTGMLKALSGGDEIYGEEKFKDGFNFKNHAKIFISANKVPVTYDTSDAFFSRWIIVNFDNQFLNNDTEGTKKANPNLLEELTTEDELSGLLNLAIRGLQRLLKNSKFSYNKTTEDIADEYRILSDPLYEFINECCSLDFEYTIPKTELYEAYINYCRSNKKTPTTQNKFSRLIPTIINVIEVTPEINKKRVKSWKGLRVIKDVTNVTHVTDISKLKVVKNNFSIDVGNDVIDKTTKVEKKSVTSVT
jgi:putative DNA primase/helicase